MNAVSFASLSIFNAPCSARTRVRARARANDAFLSEADTIDNHRSLRQARERPARFVRSSADSDECEMPRYEYSPFCKESERHDIGDAVSVAGASGAALMVSLLTAAEAEASMMDIYAGHHELDIYVLLFVFCCSSFFSDGSLMSFTNKNNTQAPASKGTEFLDNDEDWEECVGDHCY